MKIQSEADIKSSFWTDDITDRIIFRLVSNSNSKNIVTDT